MKTPWVFHKDGYIVDNEGKVVVTNNEIIFFTIKAVNNHNDLVRSLTELVAILENKYEADKEPTGTRRIEFAKQTLANAIQKIK